MASIAIILNPSVIEAAFKVADNGGDFKLPKSDKKLSVNELATALNTVENGPKGDLYRAFRNYVRTQGANEIAQLMIRDFGKGGSINLEQLQKAVKEKGDAAIVLDGKRW